jgi:hypothetical protein
MKAALLYNEMPEGRVIAAVLIAFRSELLRGGKSGLQRGTVPGNSRRGRPQGKCHRNYTAMFRHGKGETVR